MLRLRYVGSMVRLGLGGMLLMETILTAVGALANLPESPSALALPVLALGLADGLLLLWLIRRAGGTTIAAAGWWALLAVAAVTLAGWSAARATAEMPAVWAGPAQFAAAVTTFCPAMAVLGAKRPQHRAWQFVVLTLWVVLALPAAEAWLLRSSGQVEVRDARGWFLVILAILSVVNYLPTRYACAALLAGAGQALLLAGELPAVRYPLGTGGVAAALALWLLALLLVVAGMPPRARGARCEQRCWLDFRDTFGALWALRVAERLNVAARRHRWGIEIHWRGVMPADRQRDTAAPQEVAGQADPADLAEDDNRDEQAMRRSLRALLLRFVSPAWIAARCDENVH